MNLSEIQIDAEALQHNAEALKTLAPPHAKIVAVVKANAYGHGLKEVVQALEPHVDAFQVDDLDELRELRKTTQTRALVLGYVPESGLHEAVTLNGELALYDTQRIPTLRNLGAKVHLKIDALLGRQGILPNDLDQMIEALKQAPGLQVLSCYAHFANIEDAPDLSHAQAQIETFEQAYQALRQAGWHKIGRHLSATSGVMAYESPTTPNDFVRLGIGLYGMYPSAPLQRTHADLNLKPALRWVTHLAQTKTLPPHHPIGYGLTYITNKETKIGIVPQGYADGYDRGLSSSGEVLVQGQRCPILGRVAMNMFAIDLTPAPNAQPEDEVVLLGTQAQETITAEEIAARINTINYEITTRITPLLPRTVA